MRCAAPILLVAASLSAFAATHPAADASLSAVTSAYNLCSDGDTLTIPADSKTWSSGLTVSKAIWIVGAGSNSTIITSSGGITIFSLNPPSGKLTRLSGIRFNLVNWSVCYPIDVRPSGITRIDHCWFDHGYSCATYTANSGACYGVIDHCSFINADISIQMNGNWRTWLDPIAAGTTNCLVIEDNVFFKSGASDGDDQESVMSGHGVRFVVRHNTFDGRTYLGTYYPYEHHGDGNCGNPAHSCWGDDNWTAGPPIVELYCNQFLGGGTLNRVMNLRGGSILCYSNTATVTDGTRDMMQMTQDFASPNYASTDRQRTNWTGLNQICNSFFWENYENGVLQAPVYNSDPDLVGWLHHLIKQDRDFYLHAPDSNSGIVTWSDHPGYADATYTTNVAQAYYPYTALAYPHPLVTFMDGGSTNPPPVTLYSGAIGGTLVTKMIPSP